MVLCGPEIHFCIIQDLEWQKNTLTNQSYQCCTLQEYCSHPLHYFKPNVEFVFMNGDHYLSSPLQVSDIVNITLRGYSSKEKSAIIVCDSQKNAGMFFHSVTDVKIIDIAFLNCGIKTECLTNKRASLIFFSGINLSMLR